MSDDPFSHRLAFGQAIGFAIGGLTALSALQILSTGELYFLFGSVGIISSIALYKIERAL